MPGIKDYCVGALDIIIGCGLLRFGIRRVPVVPGRITVESCDCFSSLIRSVGNEMPYKSSIVISKGCIEICVILSVIRNIKIRACLSSFLDAVVHVMSESRFVIISSEGRSEVRIVLDIIIEIID